MLESSLATWPFKPRQGDAPTVKVCRSGCGAAVLQLYGTRKTALATGAACILAVRTQHCHVMSCARLQLCLLKQENSQIPHAQQGLWRLWRWIKPQSPWPVGALLPAGDVASTPTREPTEEDFATSESQVAKFKQEIVSCMDEWSDELISGLRDHGWWASSGPSLPLPLCRAMRAEVEDLWDQGHFIKSQSVLGGTVYYDKKNVYATENLCAESMLNMSVGNGAAFDAHLDVGVAEKPYNRKLSLLVYLNESWRPSLGGEIMLLGEGETEAEAAKANPERLKLPVTVSPISGRLVAFWSDRILHKVQASEVLNGMDDYRVSYVIWLLGEEESEAPSASNGEKAESAPSWAL
eukprot:symbB.v1.2.014757.t1/scaffold1081.1/size139474/14